MDDKEFYQVRLLEAKQWLVNHLSVFVENHAKVVFYQNSLKKVSKIKEPSEQDKQNIIVYQSNIEAFKDKAKKAQEQVDTFRELIKEYSKNEPVKL